MIQWKRVRLCQFHFNFVVIDERNGVDVHVTTYILLFVNREYF